LLDAVAPRLRQTAYSNLTFAYPERGRGVAAAARWMACTSPSEGCWWRSRDFRDIDKSNVAEWIRYEGFEHYERAKERGKGVLFATAHLGNWELSAFAHALLTEKMSVVVRPLDNPLIDDLVETRRALSGNTLLSKRDFARSILHALRDNEPVGILVDQNSAGDNAAFVPFFGKQACTNLTFAKLAARSGAAVIPGFAVWSDRSGGMCCGSIRRLR
jgi:KDO2-lipid IV(A) lauroyltransferase